MSIPARFGVWRAALLLAAVLVTAAGISGVTAQQAPPTPRSVMELIRVTEDVYSFRYANHITMFVVTNEGVITADPLGMQNPQAPNLLKAAIRSVTDQPVKYVIITHWGADHGMGAAAFADTATLISHPLTAQRIAQANDPTSPVPTVLVSDKMMLTLGGKQLGIYHPGRVNGDDYLLVHYPAAGIVFTVDFVRKNAVPFGNFATGHIEEWIQSLTWIETNLPFETMLLGHPPAVAGKDALREHRQYLEDLKTAIRAARVAGHEDNSEGMVAFVKADLEPRYGTWTNFANFLAANINGAIRTMYSKG